MILLVGGPLTKGALDRWGHLLGTALPIGSFLISLAMFVSLLGRRRGRAPGRAAAVHLDSRSASLDVGMDLLYDPLSALFLLLITGVGSLIHIYSIGYMAHDERRRRFFGYLNLFVAAMLMLVLSANYLGLFLGWEGVGLASYLLIGFWQHKPSAAAAAKKAFVINRVGDVGLSLAIMLMFVTFGTTDFAAISASSGEASRGHADRARPAAAARRVRQVGPGAAPGLAARRDGGPDPGLGPDPRGHHGDRRRLPRSSAPTSSSSSPRPPRPRVVVVAVVTLLWGAIIGCAKDDIKKALAGSTMSQIGYMMLGAGLGVAGYAFAIFHLLTHGFFKANMFLGAGSVMHGMDDDVDMRHYGALQQDAAGHVPHVRDGLPRDHRLPGLLRVLVQGQDHRDRARPTTGSWACSRCSAPASPAFYMTRLMLMTFFTKKRWEDDVHPHESPKVMTVPLIVLAALSVLGGVMLAGDWIVEFLAPVIGVAEHHEPPLPGAGHHAARDARRRRRAWHSPGSSSASRRCRARPRRTSRSPPAPRAPTSTATPSTTCSWSTPAATSWRA